MVREPYRWDDLLRTPPPQQLRDRVRAYCLPGPEVVAGSQRVEHALVLSWDEEGHRLVMEHRMAVEERMLAGAILAERDAVGARLDQLTTHAEANATPRVARAVGWVAARIRSLTRGTATLPDRLGRHAAKAREFLSTSTGRQRFREGLRDPRSLTGEQKAVTLFVLSVGVVSALLVAHLAVTLTAPALTAAWRTGLFLFVYGYITSLGVPLPWEPVVLATALALGAMATFIVAVLSKLVAGYMVFFLGEAVNDKLEKRATKSAWFAKFLQWSERFASRFGILAMALFIGLPGLPDAIALYVFGSLRMPMWKYLVGIAIGASVLDTLVIFGVGRVLHLG